MKMRDEHLVELVDWQLQTREVRQRPGPEIKHKQIALRIADLDQDAPRRLRPGPPRVATPEHRHAQLAVLELLLARNKRLRLPPPWFTDHRRRRDRSRSACEAEAERSGLQSPHRPPFSYAA